MQCSNTGLEFAEDLLLLTARIGLGNYLSLRQLAVVGDVEEVAEVGTQC